MNIFKRSSLIIYSLALIAWPLLTAKSVEAAQFFADQSINLSGSTPLSNVYAAGKSVTITAPATNDISVAGSTVTVNSTIDGNLNAAGGDITVNGTITHSTRLAGGTVVVNGHISQDLIVIGGDITLNSSAKVDGDVVVVGSNAIINAPVTGHITALGGDVTINSTIGSFTSNHLDSLTLGSNADIKGNMAYTSPQEAKQDKGAIVRGTTSYQPQQQSNPLLTAGFFYQLLASLIFGLVLLYVFPYVPKSSRSILMTKPWIVIGIGVLAAIFTPIAAILIGLFSPWLGIAIGLFYVLCLIVAYPLSQILLGSWLLNWWFGRNKQTYELDWRSIVIGVISFLLLSLVWIIGWLILAGFYLAAIGSFAFQIRNLNQATVNDQG